MSALTAIKAKCLDCVCNQSAEVKLCPAKTCPLWEYRKGKNPKKIYDENHIKKELPKGFRDYLNKQKLNKTMNKTNGESNV